MATGHSGRRSGKCKNLIGQRFGFLTVLGDNGRKRGYVNWLCRCACGKECCVITSVLLTGGSKSCGCLKAKMISERLTKHGYAKGVGRPGGQKPPPEYAIWRSAIDRCENPNNASYSVYGGRGIKVCEQWRNDFAAFLAYMGRRPSAKHSLDRYPDQNGNYEPGNCRWATQKEQQNNRRNNKMIEWRGRTQTAQQWADELGVPGYFIRHRLKQGWSVERALTTPRKIRRSPTKRS